jgi:hypothetical protein
MIMGMGSMKNLRAKAGRALPAGSGPDVMGRAMARPGMKKGGKVPESKEMAKKEIAFMKKKGAPKSMIKHEKKEYGFKEGGSVFRHAADGIASKGKTKGKMVKMNKGGYC